MQKCSYCGKWFKNLHDMSEHFKGSCIDEYEARKRCELETMNARNELLNKIHSKKG